MKLTVKMLEGEYWWGGSVADSSKCPYLNKDSVYSINMNVGQNQTMPLYISSKGRYIWCERPFRANFENGVITAEAPEEIILVEAGTTLRDAYLAASKAHFPFSCKVPPLKFFETAQYNTWMEYDYNQTQDGVLKYARAIVENGYEPGVIMIDEGWHGRYGLWEFDKYKFPDPKAMVDELHALGFKVMLWVVPLVSTDGYDFITNADFLNRRPDEPKLLLRTDEGKVAVVNWWNGYSAILNFCKEQDREYLDNKLRRLINDYGIDGFKFDGGNIAMYNPSRIVNGTQTKYSADELNIAWNEFGSRYEYHEYKDTFKGGGKPVIQRLQDRNHRWIGHGIDTILPAALLQGLIGHPFICPDMVGGGEWSMKYIKGFEIDEELFVRMAQCSALFPMMQFSWAPWNALGKEGQRLCHEAAMLHQKFAPYIIKLVNESAVTGEPIVRHMEYEYPSCGFEKISDQFVLGSEIIVAPVINEGERIRKVALPEGKWLYRGEVEYDGGQTIEVPAPLEVLPYFIKEGSELL